MKNYIKKITLYLLGLFIFTQQVYSENTKIITLDDSNISIEKQLHAIDIYIENNLNSREKLIDYIANNNTQLSEYIKFYNENITQEDLKKMVWIYVSLKFIDKKNIYLLKNIENSLTNISAFWRKQTETSTKKLLLRKLIKKIDISDKDKNAILDKLGTVPKERVDKLYKSVTWFIQKLEFKDFLSTIESFKIFLLFNKTKNLNFLHKSKVDINQIFKFNYCSQYDINSYEVTFNDNLHNIFKMKQCNIKIIYNGEYCTPTYFIATSEQKCKYNSEYIKKMEKISSFEKRNVSINSEAIFMIEKHLNWKDYKSLLPTSGKSGFYIDCSGKVVYVMQGSPADIYGIKEDDIITSLKNCSSTPFDIFEKSFENTNNFIGLPNKIYKIELLRDKKVIKLKLRSD